ncbi:pentatricopeptide repeat-containing protein [Quercus suber]|uniref:Pentatricopeptide repeat-containing protein n=1 Tax=Quercus suber TaxID=58331 RepID=A0AAW0LZL9_QUESU
MHICEWMTLQQDIRLQTGDYAVHLDLIAKVRGVNSAEKFFEDLPDKMTGHLTCSALLHVYVQNKLSAKAEALMAKMTECGFLKNSLPYNHMLSLYISNGQLEKVPGMEKKAFRANRAAYSSLLSLHTNMGDKDEVHRIWKKMISLYRKMSDAEYTCMLSSLVKLGEFEEAESLYREWETVSGTGDARVSNILLAAYINRNQMEMAENFYNQMVEKGITPSYTTWELLTWGYLNQKQMEKVLDYFTKAVGSVKKWNPDERLVREVFKKYEEQGNVEGAEKILVVLRKAGHLSTEVYNSLLRTYAKAGKMPLIVAERMEKDKVWLNEETHELIKLTSKMCVSEASITYS